MGRLYGSKISLNSSWVRVHNSMVILKRLKGESPWLQGKPPWLQLSIYGSRVSLNDSSVSLNGYRASLKVAGWASVVPG